MKTQDLNKPAVPIGYAALMLELATARGASRERLLDDLAINDADWQRSDARISLLQTNRLLYRAIKLSGEPALGCELGLRAGLTMHGVFGYGLGSQPNFGAAMKFACRYLPLLLPNLCMTLVDDGRHCALDVAETTPLGDLRHSMYELFLLGIVSAAKQMLAGTGQEDPEFELWFDTPEPEYHARYRDRLPPSFFSMGVARLRFPASLMAQGLATANAITAELAQQQCEREVQQLGLTEDFLARVRAELQRNGRSYPDVETLSARLFMSGRTLKRKLRERGMSFQQLLDYARRHDSICLLRDPHLSVESIAEQVAYSDAANFTRAFRKWMGQTPSAFRARLQPALLHDESGGSRALSGARRLGDAVPR